MNQPLFSYRGFRGLAVLVFCLASTSSAFAEFLTRRDATVGEIELKYKVVTFLVAPKARIAKAAPERHRLAASSEVVFRELPSRRKVQASFADLQIGQRVILSGISGISTNVATEIVILPAKPK